MTMKILWITNIVFPEAQSLLSGEGSLKSSGGWLLGAANALTANHNINLTIATVSRDVNCLTCLQGEKTTYYLLPFGKGNTCINPEYKSLWRDVCNKVHPDVVHIHGTEYSHGLAYIEACGANNVCVSIQGLVGPCSYYYYYGLSKWEVRKAVTLKSLLRGGILKGYRKFVSSGMYEKETIKRVSHIIGRTSWDHDRTWAINPNAIYHYGGETLRSEFYCDSIWDYNKCRPHSIFLSQAYYPIKGLHMVLKAMPLILRHYPDATIRIAGDDICGSKNFIQSLKISDYGNIIRKLIKRYGLQNHVEFTGALDAAGMKHEYLMSNVFVCPSSIENSPNSLGEAQILGVPVVASYVGGVMDMMRGDEDNLYRFEEFEMLASKVVRIFSQEGTINTGTMRQEAIRRHNPSDNTKQLLKVYYSIAQISGIDEV